MLDPNLRCIVTKPQENGSVNISKHSFLIDMGPLLTWLEQNDILYYWCDSYQEKQVATGDELHKWYPDDNDDGEGETIGLFKINIHPPKLQFLSLRDYTLTKLSWQGLYSFSQKELEPLELKGYFKEFRAKMVKE